MSATSATIGSAAGASGASNGSSAAGANGSAVAGAGSGSASGGAGAAGGASKGSAAAGASEADAAHLRRSGGLSQLSEVAEVGRRVERRAFRGLGAGRGHLPRGVGILVRLLDRFRRRRRLEHRGRRRLGLGERLGRRLGPRAGRLARLPRRRSRCLHSRRAQVRERPAAGASRSSRRGASSDPRRPWRALSLPPRWRSLPRASPPIPRQRAPEASSGRPSP